MKLYELEQGDYFEIIGDEEATVFLFDRVDGMYSVCYTRDSEVVHLVAYTPVKRIASK